MTSLEKKSPEQTCKNCMTQMICTSCDSISQTLLSTDDGSDLSYDSKSFISEGSRLSSSRDIHRALATSTRRAIPSTHLEILETPVRGTIDGTVLVMTPMGPEEKLSFKSEKGYKALVRILDGSGAEIYRGPAYYQMDCFNPFRNAVSFDSSNVIFKEESGKTWHVENNEKWNKITENSKAQLEKQRQTESFNAGINCFRTSLRNTKHLNDQKMKDSIADFFQTNPPFRIFYQVMLGLPKASQAEFAEHPIPLMIKSIKEKFDFNKLANAGLSDLKKEMEVQVAKKEKEVSTLQKQYLQAGASFAQNNYEKEFKVNYEAEWEEELKSKLIEIIKKIESAR